MPRSRLSRILLPALALVVCAAAVMAAAPSDPVAERMSALEKRVAELEAQISGLRIQVSRQHPDPATERAAAQKFALINAKVAAGQAAEAKPELDAFLQEYPNTQAGARAQSMARDLASIGKAVPADWDIAKWYQGDASDLQSGEATVAVFWETWCPHCRRALPQLQTLYQKYQGQGLSVVGFTRLSRGGTDQAVSEFLGQNSIAFPIAKETGRLSAYFGVSSIPAAAVIKDGKVVWSGHPAGINEAMVQSWVGDTAS